MRKIAKNEEISISYIDNTQSFEERQNALSSMYAFGCGCRKCAKGYKDSGEVLTGNPIHDTAIRNAKSELHTLLDALVNDTLAPALVEARAREICGQQISEKPWPINAYPLPDLYGLLALKFEAAEQWEEALRTRLRIVYMIDPLCYPERINPHRVEHLMALCQTEG